MKTLGFLGENVIILSQFEMNISKEKFIYTESISNYTDHNKNETATRQQKRSLSVRYHLNHYSISKGSRSKICAQHHKLFPHYLLSLQINVCDKCSNISALLIEVHAHKGRDCLSHTTVVSGFMCSCIFLKLKKKIKV